MVSGGLSLLKAAMLNLGQRSGTLYWKGHLAEKQQWPPQLGSFRPVVLRGWTSRSLYTDRLWLLFFFSLACSGSKS